MESSIYSNAGTDEIKSSSSKQTIENCIGNLSDTDPYGFVREDDFDYKSYEEFESEYLSILTRRSMRWKKVMTKEKFRHDRRTKRFCRKGIPQEYRSKVWMDVSGAKKNMEQKPTLFYTLQNTVCKDAATESLLQEAVSTDLDRTFPDNINFMNGRQDDQKAKLRNVLIAYGRHNPDVAYCQGMNYLAATLLLVVKDEEKCFWLLCALIDDILPSYYTNEMLALRADLATLDDLVKSKYPDVDAKMKQLDASWMLLASKWFICMFVDVIPIETVLRIWDCLYFEGSKVLFRAALTIIHQKKSELLKCDNLSELAELFRFSKSEATTLDCHKFMQLCFTVPNPLKKKALKNLRERNVALLEKEDEERRKK